MHDDRCLISSRICLSEQMQKQEMIGHTIDYRYSNYLNKEKKKFISILI
jgi:hypothetical protein